MRERGGALARHVDDGARVGGACAPSRRRAAARRAGSSPGAAAAGRPREERGHRQGGREPPHRPPAAWFGDRPVEVARWAAGDGPPGTRSRLSGTTLAGRHRPGIDGGRGRLRERRGRRACAAVLHADPAHHRRRWPRRRPPPSAMRPDAGRRPPGRREHGGLPADRRHDPRSVELPRRGRSPRSASPIRWYSCHFCFSCLVAATGADRVFGLVGVELAVHQAKKVPASCPCPKSGPGDGLSRPSPPC